MELIPPEPQVGFRLCLVLLMLGCNKFLLGRFGSWIDPLSGTTLLLIFLGQVTTRQDELMWILRFHSYFTEDCNEPYF